MSADRRESQRLKLEKPILASVRGQGALILDIGSTGVFFEQYGTFAPGDRFPVSFLWRGQELAFVCEVARTSVARTASDGSSVSHVGARFVEAVGDSEERLDEMLASIVAPILLAQRANAEAVADDGEPLLLLKLGGARRARSHGFITYVYADGVWSRVVSESQKQPANGFTVAAHEDEEELQLLCDAWEHADDEGRNLIRLLAELSVRASRGRV